MYKYKKILLSTALALSSMPLFAADYYVVLPSSSSAKPALDLKVSLSLAALPPGDVGRTYVFDFNEALMVTGDSQFDSQAVQWSISPELPEGLFFEGGVLSGAPTLTSQPVNYTISASYKGVSANQTYALAVDGPKGEKLANGVTVRCTGMADGEQFELDGKRYRVVYSKADAKAYAAEACTTNMTDMSMMMFGASFNENISHWDTANVISMYYMFGGANAFDQPIGYWDTSKVTAMDYMFQNAQAFNQPIGDWNTANVTKMNLMFSLTKSFNQPIGGWNTSNVARMDAMFNEAQAFNQPIGDWDTSNVTRMDNMFYKAEVFSQPICDWDVGSITAPLLGFKDNAPLSDANAPKFSGTNWGTACN